MKKEKVSFPSLELTKDGDKKQTNKQTTRRKIEV
jgi:hypothetical protein